MDGAAVPVSFPMALRGTGMPLTCKEGEAMGTTARHVAPFMTPAAVRKASDELRRQEDELQAATAAILAEITQGQCDPSQLIQQLPAQHGLSTQSVRAALWGLLNSRDIVLTEERLLVLPSQLTSD